MELADKLKKLRKRQDITQQQLAEKLHVSRTAISKWETGRGTPSIDSLKAIAELYDVSMDALLSTDELVVVAQNENKNNLTQLSGLIFALLDLAAIIGFLLPIYGQKGEQIIQSVSLFHLQSGIRYVYIPLLAILTICGIVEVIFLFQKKVQCVKLTVMIGVIVHILVIFLFIASQQPYAAALYFLFLIVKSVLFLRQNRILKQ